MSRVIKRTAWAMAALLIVVALLTAFVAGTASGTRWLLARSTLPLSWQQLDGTLLHGLRIDELRYDDGANRVAIRQLGFAWQPWRLLDGSLVLDEVQAGGVTAILQGSSTEPLTPALLQRRLFALPFAVQLQSLVVDDFRLEGRTALSVDRVTGSLLLDAGALELQRISLQLPAAAISGDLLVKADLSLQAALEWQVQRDGRDYAGTLQLGGSLQQLTASHHLTAPLDITSSGTLQPGLFAGSVASVALQHTAMLQPMTPFGQPELQMGGSITTYGPAAALRIDAELDVVVPQLAPFTAALTLLPAGDTVRIERLALAGDEFALEGSGAVQLSPVSLQLDWNLARLDVGTRWPQLELADVAGNGALTLALTDGTIDGSLSVAQLQAGLRGHPLTLGGEVQLQDSELTGIRLQAGSGGNTLDMAGAVGEQLDLDWQLQAPALQNLMATLAGSIDGSGHVGGTRAAPALDGALQGSQLRYRVGAASWTLDSLRATARFDTDGNDVQLQLQGLRDSTRTWLQSGTLAASGSLASHDLELMLSAPQVAFSLVAQGGLQQQHWQARITQSALTGAYGNWRLLAPATFDYDSGILAVGEHCWGYLETRLCASATQRPGENLVAGLTLREAPLAWLNSGAQAPASKPPALQQLQDARSWHVGAGVQVAGMLDTTMQLQRAPTGVVALTASVQPRDVVVQLTREADQAGAPNEVQRYGVAVNRGELALQDGNWRLGIDVDLSQLLADTTVLQGSIDGDISLAADETLGGTLSARFGDLGWIEPLWLPLNAPSGRLQASLALAGTRTQPVARLSASLADGSVDLPLYGLQLRDAGLTLETAANGDWQLSGSARSGDGAVNMTALIRTPMSSSRVIEAQLRGDSVQAYNSNAVRATLSPDLNLRYGADGIVVGGTLALMDSSFDLEALFGANDSTAVRLSTDVTVVRGELIRSSELARQRVPLTLNLRVRVGEKVRVSGYDLDASLAGELDLQQPAGRPLLVYGQLDVPAGRYSIYNQQLTIDGGRLGFLGNPANPALDLRAFRSTRTAQVGVQLSGTLKDVRGELYSTPVLPPNEMLALLVTGKAAGQLNVQESGMLLAAITDLGLARGQDLAGGLTDRVTSTLGLDSLSIGGGETLQDSALGLGKYLSPSLLVRYKVGLFDRQSVLGIEYTLNDNLRLNVESGISQSVELSYTIEK